MKNTPLYKILYPWVIENCSVDHWKNRIAPDQIGHVARQIAENFGRSGAFANHCEGLTVVEILNEVKEVETIAAELIKESLTR